MVCMLLLRGAGKTHGERVAVVDRQVHGERVAARGSQIYGV